MKKHILQLIVDYDVMWDAKKVEFAKSGTRFRLSWKPSLWKNLSFKNSSLIMTS